MAEGTRTLPRGVREGFGVEATFVVGEERGNLTFGGHSGMPRQHGQSLGKLEARGWGEVQEWSHIWDGKENDFWRKCWMFKLQNQLRRLQLVAQTSCFGFILQLIRSQCGLLRRGMTQICVCLSFRINVTGRNTLRSCLVISAVSADPSC